MVSAEQMELLSLENKEIINCKISTRDKLLFSALELFYTHGYHSTTIESILHYASIHKGSFYHFFNSKKAIFLAIINELIAKNIQTKYASIYDSKRPLVTLFDILIHSNHQDFIYSYLVFETKTLDREIVNDLQKITAAIEEYYLFAFQSEYMDNSEPSRLATMLLATVKGATSQYQHTQLYFEIIETIKSLLLNHVQENRR